MRKVKIGDKVIGDREPCFVVADIGSNHDGKIEQAKQLIDLAKEAGCDAVKFQLFTAEKYFNKYFKYPREDLIDCLRKLEIPKEWLSDLPAYCSQKGIIFLASVFDEEKVDWLEEAGVLAYKVASYELTHIPLLKYIAKKRKPIILSSGMAVEQEIRESIEAIYQEGNKDIVLMHCVSAYPTKFEELNLKTINYYKKIFDIPTGLSDHSPGPLSSAVAVALGANIIEKHISLDKNLPGPDHFFSLGKEEIKKWVSQIREVENSLKIKKEPTPGERNELLWRRAIWAREDIPQGTELTEDMLIIARPSPQNSLEPKRIYEVFGRKTKEDIKKGELITWEKLV